MSSAARFTDFVPVVIPPGNDGIAHFGIRYKFDGVECGRLVEMAMDPVEHERALAAHTERLA